MSRLGIGLGRAGSEGLDHLLDRARTEDVTYSHPGSTLTHAPAGTAEHTFTLAVHGEVADAAAALRRWATHDGLGARVLPEGSDPAVGDTVLVVLPFGPAEMVVANRIVAVLDESDRCGIAYGTLPGHPESGEELFLAESTGDHRLRLTIRIHARPASAVLRILGPVVSRIQAAAARRYLASWERAIDTAGRHR